MEWQTMSKLLPVILLIILAILLSAYFTYLDIATCQRNTGASVAVCVKAMQ